MKSVINSTIAARMNLHHESQLSKADAVANGIDRKLAGIWNQILTVLGSRRGVMEKQYAIRNLLMKIVDQTASKLHGGLKTIATQSYEDAANVLSKNVPLGHLNLVVAKKPVLEGKDAIRQQIHDAVFDQLPPDKIDKIVRGTTAGMSWQGRLAQQTSKGSPDQLASVVTMGYLSGATPASLAGKLKPFVQGISSTARRVARNESMRIAHEASMEAYGNLGDMCIGYQIHATMDSRVRPHHAARSGNVYYKTPKPGQLSAARMPRPPLEEDGTVAHNCRCWVTPVLEVQKHIEEDPAAKAVFTDARGKLIPNPAVYTEWFDTASEEDKRRVVGARRLKVIRDRLVPGEKLSWGHFVDPKSGKLKDHESLATESPEQNKKRLAKFNDLIRQRKQLTHDVYTHGYIPPAQSGPAPAAPPPPQKQPAPAFIPLVKSKSDIDQARLVSPIKKDNAYDFFSTTKEAAKEIMSKKYFANGRNALVDYGRKGHLAMNLVANNPRAQGGPSSLENRQARKSIAKLDQVIADHGQVIPVGAVLLRGMNVKNGLGIPENGFTSCSVDYNTAKKFAAKRKGRVYTITVLRPIKGIYMPKIRKQTDLAKSPSSHKNLQQMEIILERKLKITYTNTQLPDGTYEAFII